MKIAILGDTHFGVRNDSENFESFFFNFYDNVFFPYLEEHGIDTVIQTGDLMDKRKNVNYRTLNKVSQAFLGKMKEQNVTLHLIPGNHDIYYRNSNVINSMTELFSWMGHIRIYNEPTTIEFGGKCLDFIPWMNKYNSAKSLDFIEKSTSTYCVGHFEIDGFDMFAGVESKGGSSKSTFSGYELVMSGHYHHKSSNGNITYVGTPYEMTWADFDDPKGFHVLDTETGDLTFVENPYRMFHKVFYSSEIDYADHEFHLYADSIVKIIVQDKIDNEKFEWFVAKITANNPLDISIVESDVTVLKGVDEEKFDTLDTFSVLISAAIATAENEGLNPTRMGTIMKELYHEAIEIGRES